MDFETQDPLIVDESPERSAFNELVDVAKEASDESACESFDLVHPSISERVIFCLDGYLSVFGQALIRKLSVLINNYTLLKRKISAETVEFGILLMGKESSTYIPIPSKKNVNNVLVALSKMDLQDTEPYDFSLMFFKLAEILEIPDSNYFSPKIPPSHCYHLILLFARNNHIPTMSQTDPFYFILDSPYVTLDVVYFCDSINKGQQKIINALKGLNSLEKGYFYQCGVHDFEMQQSCFIKLLGHCMIRKPQNLAIFNVHQKNKCQ